MTVYHNIDLGSIMNKDKDHKWNKIANNQSFDKMKAFEAWGEQILNNNG